MFHWLVVVLPPLGLGVAWSIRTGFCFVFFSFKQHRWRFYRSKLATSSAVVKKQKNKTLKVTRETWTICRRTGTLPAVKASLRQIVFHSKPNGHCVLIKLWGLSLLISAFTCKLQQSHNVIIMSKPHIFCIKRDLNHLRGQLISFRSL